MADRYATPSTPAGWWKEGEAAGDLSAELLMLRYQCWRWRILYALAVMAIWGGWPG